MSYASSCILRKVTVNTVHITEDSKVNYSGLQKKWKKHLPLGKKTGNPLEDLKLVFPTMLNGKVGLFEGETSLKLSPDAKPGRKGIIQPCPETTDWVHNLVTVMKKNGTLRLCLNPRNLNKHLIRNVHYTASWEDVQHSFKNGSTSQLSTPNLDIGQNQLLTAFNTLFKKYCFVRLPFGLSVLSEIFCKHMDQALDGIPIPMCG